MIGCDWSQSWENVWKEAIDTISLKSLKKCYSIHLTSLSHTPTIGHRDNLKQSHTCCWWPIATCRKLTTGPQPLIEFKLCVDHNECSMPWVSDWGDFYNPPLPQKFPFWPTSPFSINSSTISNLWIRRHLNWRHIVQRMNSPRPQNSIKTDKI